MKSFMAALRTLVLPFGATSGTRVILDGVNGLIQFYDAANNLVQQLDSTGYQVGPTLQTANTARAQLLAGGNAGLLLTPGAHVGNVYNPGDVFVTTQGATQALSQGLLQLDSPLDTVQAANAASVKLLSASHDATLPSMIRLDADQVMSAAPIYANVSGAIDDWHAMTLANGWTNFGGGDVSAKYRKLASPPKSVHLVGVIAPGTKTDGTVVWTAPLGYLPASAHIFPVSYDGGATSNARMAFNTSGQLMVDGVNVVGLAAVEFNVIIPLDA